MDKGELEQLRSQIAAYMESVVKKDEMLFFLLTDILTESSDLVFAGEGAKEVAEAAFGPAEENWVHVPGMVSRKKQFVPSVLSALQQ
jgi:manganese-dependent inorganic pyrophosphatase